MKRLAVGLILVSFFLIGCGKTEPAKKTGEAGKTPATAKTGEEAKTK